MWCLGVCRKRKEFKSVKTRGTWLPCPGEDYWADLSLIQKKLSFSLALGPWGKRVPGSNFHIFQWGKGACNAQLGLGPQFPLGQSSRGCLQQHLWVKPWGCCWRKRERDRGTFRRQSDQRRWPGQTILQVWGGFGEELGKIWKSGGSGCGEVQRTSFRSDDDSWSMLGRERCIWGSVSPAVLEGQGRVEQGKAEGASTCEWYSSICLPVLRWDLCRRCGPGVGPGDALGALVSSRGGGAPETWQSGERGGAGACLLLCPSCLPAPTILTVTGITWETWF